MTPERNPAQEFGLPATWKPVPVAWGLGKMQTVGPAGVETMHVLIVATDTGIHGYKFSPDELRAVANKMLEEASGLQLASKIETPNGTFHRPTT